MLSVSGLWLNRGKGWIGGTYQNCNRLRRATAPLTFSAMANICWRLYAARRHKDSIFITVATGTAEISVEHKF
uniref:Uncharacterized protein n=1 Tax=Citrobacter freundii TaxID=546 RepID=A0A3S5I464_CITFR|nr:hypothetical protein [Citrobacter freundii]